MTSEAPARSSVRGLGWPCTAQLALLQVLAAPPDAARTAWYQWRERARLTALDAGSTRLLPLVVRRLSELGVEDAEFGVFLGVLRHGWVGNQLHVRAAIEASSALLAEGIAVCALKGLSLLTSYYDADFSSRPMYDVDLLVPAERAADALAILLSSGWTPQQGFTRRAFVTRELKTQHAYDLRRGPLSLDLHWHVLHQDLSPFFDRIAWAHAASIEGSRFPSGLLALSATEQLIQVCLHGVRHDSRANRSWALDALRIVNHRTRPVDFERLTRIALARRLVVPLEDALYFLTTLGCRIPCAVFEQLAQAPVVPLEILEYHGITGPWREVGARARDATVTMRDLRARYEHLTPEVVAACSSDPPLLTPLRRRARS